LTAKQKRYFIVCAMAGVILGALIFIWHPASGDVVNAAQLETMEDSTEETVLFLLPENPVCAVAEEKEVQMTDEETRIQTEEFIEEKGVNACDEDVSGENGSTEALEAETVSEEDPDREALSAEEDSVPEQSNDVQTQISWPDYLTIEPGCEGAGEIANAAWNSLPNSVRCFVAERGWQICITSGWFGNAYGYSVPLSGLTVYDERTSYITGTEFCINRALIHEIGHIVDEECGYPSLSEEFLQIYFAESPGWYEVENYGDDHGKSNSQEYFAETFKYILRYGDAYADTAPATYEFVRGYIP